MGTEAPEGESGATGHEVPAGARNGVDWFRVVEAVGAVTGILAGLVGWIVLAGGLRMGARFHAADLPVVPGVTMLPREVLLAEGLRTLLVPILVGAAAALGVLLFTRRDTDADTGTRASEDVEAAASARREWDEVEPVVEHRLLVFGTALDPAFGEGEDRGERWTRTLNRIGSAVKPRSQSRTARITVALVGAAAGVSFIVIVVWLFSQVDVLWAFLVILATLIAIVLALGARRKWGGGARLAAALFAAVTLWSGVVIFLAELGAKHSRLAFGIVDRRTPLGDLAGLFVARSSGDVYLAVGDESDPRMVIVPASDVEELWISTGEFDKEADLSLVDVAKEEAKEREEARPGGGVGTAAGEATAAAEEAAMAAADAAKGAEKAAAAADEASEAAEASAGQAQTAATQAENAKVAAEDAASALEDRDATGNRPWRIRRVRARTAGAATLTRSATVMCADGEVALGGGAGVTEPRHVAIARSRPKVDRDGVPRGWVAWAYATNDVRTRWTLNVHVICTEGG